MLYSSSIGCCIYKMQKTNMRKKIVRLFILLFFFNALGISYAQSSETNKVDSIYGYLNNDIHLDLITIKSDGNIPPVIDFKIFCNLGSNNYRLIKDKHYVALDNVSIPKISITGDGDIHVIEYHYRFEMIYKYKFFEPPNDWILYSTELLDKYDDHITPSEVSVWPLYKTRLIGTNHEASIDIVTKNQYNSIVQELNKQYDLILNEHRTKKYKKIYNYKKEEFDSILRYVGISSNNVQKLNDIAFFLLEAGNCQEATNILENVIYKFPNRTVAYINLGDAYWGLGEQKQAKEAYENYIELMKTNGKESKIPQRVYERIKKESTEEF